MIQPRLGVANADHTSDPEVLVRLAQYSHKEYQTQ